MNLDRTNQWLTLAANIGVILGIVFLAWEIQQNTRSVETAAYQDLIARIVDLNEEVATNSELAKIILDARTKTELTDEQYLRYFAYIASLLRHADMAYFQFEQGLISKTRLDSATAPLRSQMRTNHAKRIWNSMKEQSSFSREFVDYIDEFIMAGEPSPEISWTEAEGFPYGGTYIGHEAVLQNVFAKLGSEWDGYAAVPEELIASGDTVIALGEYSGTYKATGKSISVPFVHVWRFEGDHVVSFRQHTDTAVVQRVLQ